MGPKVKALLLGLYLSQWLYLALVGWPTGRWDMAYTQAEKSLEKRPPYSQASLERFRQAARLAESLDPEDGRLARSYHDLGTVLWFAGSPVEGRLYLLRALEIFERVDGSNSTWVGMVCQRLGEIEMFRGRTPESLAHLQRAESILLRTVGRFDPMALRTVTLIALQTQDRVKAKQLVETYPMSTLQIDPLLRLQLRQISVSP